MKWQDSSIGRTFAYEDNSLCYREALEYHFGRPFPGLVEDLEYWRNVVVIAKESEDPAAVLRKFGDVNLVDPPEGTSWLRWAEWVQERLTEVVEHPETAHRGLAFPGQYQWHRRGSVLDDDAAVTARLEASQRATAEELLQRPGASIRCHLLVDTGSPIGWAVELDAEERVNRRTPTTWAGVVFARTPDGEARVVDAYAAGPEEDPRAGSWRERWPTLHAVLGGWFSEGAFKRSAVLPQQHIMLATEPSGVLARVAAEGGDLLGLDDGELRAACIALGCYIEPPHLRLWLEWMFWRIGRFEWK